MKPQLKTRIFDELLIDSSKTFLKGSKGNVYDEILKKFSTLLYVQGGPNLYDMLYQNSSLPSKCTVKKVLSNTINDVEIGTLNFKCLKLHMQNYPNVRHIMISEDASRIKSRVTFDQNSNCLLGLVPPTDPATGLPIINFFTVKSPSQIMQYLT